MMASSLASCSSFGIPQRLTVGRDEIVGLLVVGRNVGCEVTSALFGDGVILIGFGAGVGNISTLLISER